MNYYHQIMVGTTINYIENENILILRNRLIWIKEKNKYFTRKRIKFLQGDIIGVSNFYYRYGFENLKN